MTDARKRLVCFGLLGVFIPALLFAAYLRATLVYVFNASTSLQAPAFAMVTWPVFRASGIFVSFTPPEEIDRGVAFVKRIEGVPGDVVSILDGQSCINDKCLILTGEAPYFAEATPPQIIPAGHYFVVGETANSFDSRYAVMGLITEQQIIAGGWALNFMPEWEGRF